MLAVYSLFSFAAINLFRQFDSKFASIQQTSHYDCVCVCAVRTPFHFYSNWKGCKLTKNSHAMNFTVANYEKLSILHNAMAQRNNFDVVNDHWIQCWNQSFASQRAHSKSFNCRPAVGTVVASHFYKTQSTSGKQSNRFEHQSKCQWVATVSAHLIESKGKTKFGCIDWKSIRKNQRHTTERDRDEKFHSICWPFNSVGWERERRSERKKELADPSLLE